MSDSTVCGSILIGPQCADGRPQVDLDYPGSAIEQAKPDLLFEMENISHEPVQGSGASHEEHPGDGKNAVNALEQEVNTMFLHLTKQVPSWKYKILLYTKCTLKTDMKEI